MNKNVTAANMPLPLTCVNCSQERNEGGTFPLAVKEPEIRNSKRRLLSEWYDSATPETQRGWLTCHARNMNTHSKCNADGVPA